MQNSILAMATDRLKTGLRTATQLGASAAKLHFAQSERLGCSFESGRLKSADTRQSLSYHVEVLVNGRRAGTVGNRLDDMDEMIERAIGLAKAGSVAHFETYPAPAEIHRVKTHSAKALSLTRDQMIAGCQAIVDALKAYDPELYLQAGAERGESEGVLVTTSGVQHATADTHWSMSAFAQRTEGTDMLFAGYGRSWLDLNEYYDPEFIAREILEDLANGESIADAPSGKTVALLSPEIFGMLLRPILLGVNGRNVAKGDSPLRGRLGEQILDERLSLIDDPHLDYCPGAGEMDGNGVPTRVIPIVENGVLKNFLYDLDSAGLAGAQPSGNDACSPNSLDVPPGDEPSERLLAGITDGIYIKQLLGFGQSNIINGDFSSNVSLGYRIRDGKITGRLKNTMVAGNVYELFKKNVRLSSDRDPVERLGHALIEDLNVSTAANG